MKQAAASESVSATDAPAILENVGQLRSWLRGLPKHHELTPLAILSVLDLIESGYGPGGVVERREEEMKDLTLAEFAKIMGRAGSTVTHWCASGQVPGAYKLRGWAWRIPRASVQRFKDAQAQPKLRPQKGELMAAVHARRRETADSKFPGGLLERYELRSRKKKGMA
jgi:hypothetical protein